MTDAEQAFADKKVKQFLNQIPTILKPYAGNFLHLGTRDMAVLATLVTDNNTGPKYKTPYGDYTEGSLRYLVELAYYDPSAFKCARILVACILCDYREPPKHLLLFAAGVLDGSLKPPKGKEGRPSNWERDLFLIQLIKDLTGSIEKSGGAKKYAQNRAKHTVQRAFEKQGVHLTLATLEKAISKKSNPYTQFEDHWKALQKVGKE